MKLIKQPEEEKYYFKTTNLKTHSAFFVFEQIFYFKANQGF